jgi:lysophospholipase L1-like esterase
MKLKDGQTVLFTGDSITDCGRAHPVGMRAGLGEGYVAFVDSLLATCHPEEQLRILNTGISGNRVVDLEIRWQKDVLDLKPDWLAVMIGINDVWRQFDSPHDPNQVTVEKYEKTYRELLTQARTVIRGLVLMTPYFIEINRNDPMRTQMDVYGEVVRRLSTEFDTVLVDVQCAFDEFLLHRPAQSLCDDRVHPNMTGHMIIARAFLSAVGCDWNRANKAFEATLDSAPQG